VMGKIYFVSKTQFLFIELMKPLLVCIFCLGATLTQQGCTTTGDIYTGVRIHGKRERKGKRRQVEEKTFVPLSLYVLYSRFATFLCCLDNKKPRLGGLCANPRFHLFSSQPIFPIDPTLILVCSIWSRRNVIRSFSRFTIRTPLQRRFQSKASCKLTSLLK